MGNIVIRKARKEYVCDVCGHIIHSGEEYLDEIVYRYGTVVSHKRYHDECPKPEEPYAIMELLIKNNGELFATLLDTDTKIKIVGIVYKNCDLFVVFNIWGEEKRLLMPIDYYKTRVQVITE